MMEYTMSKEKNYDISNPKEIEKYAKKLIGKTFEEIIKDNYPRSWSDGVFHYYGKTSRKGGLGNLLEEQYFGYSANNISRADFPEAGVELKVSPYEIKKNNTKRAGERIVLSMISYDKPIEKSLFESHMWNKCRLLLLIYYLRDKSLGNNLKYRIDYVSLFTPPEEDLEIIKNDYDIIAHKIQEGKAHELSEGDTLYLGACTKGATAAKSRVPQYYAPEIYAQKRAFCYKNSYMTFVLNNYLVPGKETYESIVKDVKELKEKSFRDIVIDKINGYIGKSDEELCIYFDREYNNNKAQWVDLVYKMLGIKSNRAAEFVKANIAVKVIRIEDDNSMRESMSLAPFKFMEVAEEEFEESALCRFFEETQLLFVIWKKDNDTYRLKGAKLWNMPEQDLYGEVYDGWKITKDIIIKGIDFEKKGNVVKNNLPKKKDNRIIHVRPHAQRSAYKFSDGTVIGDIARDANVLPNGEYMTTQSFWLNNSYVLEQIKDFLG